MTRRRSDDEERRALRQALADVKPLSDRGKRAAKPRPAAPAPPRTAERPVEFEVRRSGAHLEGRAPGVDRRLLERLRRGHIEADLEVDLHGLRAGPARRALRAALEQARREELRCVLVVHGRGLRSPAGPVLKESLVTWLAEPPHGEAVLAFASADGRAGGTGATRVLLRRRR